MNIVNGLYERITDFENILEATKGKSYNEAFKWRGKNYNSFKELLNDYCKLENCCEEDKFYRALRLELTPSEYFLFFTDTPRIDYVYKEERLKFTDVSDSKEYFILNQFYRRFLLFAY